MAIISWDECVISVAEPPIVSESLVSGILAGSGLLLPVSPSHVMDGLKSLSRKVLGGTASRFAPMRVRISAA